MKRSREDGAPPHSALAALGYAYIPGPSGDKADWVLRQLRDPSAGFSWRGQSNYDQLGAAAVRWVRGALVGLCGLEPLDVLSPTTIYATPDIASHSGTVLLLVCGSAPGGDAGVWGRSLCINGTTAQGAQFDYIERAHALGWAVVVADPHGASSPHTHLCDIWESVIPSTCSSVAIVAHSYGAPLAVHLMKANPSALSRVSAIALTDGMAWTPDGWVGSFDALLCEVAPAEGEGHAAVQRAYAAAAPLAFQPPTAEVRSRIAAVGCNFVASPLPAGEVVPTESATVDAGELMAVSAGAEAHPSTTYAATEVVFAFLEKAIGGK